MNTEFKTLDGAVDDYYYKRGDDYVDQYDDAIYPATSLPPQTEIVTRVVTNTETETTTEEYTEYVEVDYGETYTTGTTASNSGVLGFGLLFVIVLVIAAIATVVAMVVNENKKKQELLKKRNQATYQNYQDYQNNNYPHQ